VSSVLNGEGGCLPRHRTTDHGRRTTHLVAHVHTVRERLHGYENGMATTGIPSDDRLIHLDQQTAAQAHAATAESLALPQPPTALFTLNSLCTIGAARALRDTDLESRVALIGFDDLDLADLLTPPVTVVAHDVTETGRQAAQLLFARINGHDQPPRQIILPITMVARGSGEIRPVSASSGTTRPVRRR
jgi:LacI family transcriptional regulator